ncbi:alpha/beta hydrolase [Streptomyces tsukubensis]
MAEPSVPEPQNADAPVPGCLGLPVPDFRTAALPDPDPTPEPDAAAVARDAAEAEAAFAHPPVAPDTTWAYGDHPDQIVDLYAPRGPERESAPLVVVFHGGAWRSPYDRVHISPFADFLARRGFAVASVEYRRGRDIPQPRVSASSGAADTAAPVAGRWPETFDDVAAAMDALPGAVARLLPGADLRRTVLTGHSAGGHLALWAAARHVLPRGSAWRTEAPANLRGVVALAPLADLAKAAELGVCGGAVRQLLGEGNEFAERCALADPALLLPTGIATVLVQGQEDIVVPPAVADAYAEAAAKAGEAVGLTLLPEVGHFPLIDPAADACAVAAEEIAQLAW